VEPDRRFGRVHFVHRVNAASAFIVGSVVAVDPLGLWPFGPLRWLVISTLGLVVWAICMRRPAAQLDRRTLGLWMLLLVFLALGAMTNGDVWVAFVGSDTRHFGLFTWVLCWGLFCAGQQLRGCEAALRRGGTIAALLVGLWCAWEALIGPPIALGVNTSRLTGPFGSSALLGAALCLLLPFAIAVAADSAEPRVWRVGATIAGALGAVAIVGSGARAAWVGLLFAAIMVAWKVPSTRKAFAVAGGAVVAVMLLLLTVTSVGSVVERSHGTTSRLDEWSLASRVIANHPMLGVGPEGYRIAVSEAVDAEYERAHPRDSVLPDRAHASLLDVALAGGVAASAAYASLLVIIGRRAMRRLASGSMSHVALTASLLAYFSAQLLLFPVSELDPIAWLLAGVVAAGTTPPRPRRALVVHAKTAVASVVVIVAIVAGVLDVAANRLAYDAVAASADGNGVAAREVATRATRLRPDSIAYRMIAVQVLLAADTVTATDLALAQATDALDWSRHDPIAVDLWASGLLQRAVQTGDQVDGRSALAAWEVLVARDPSRARWQLQLGRAAAVLGEVDIAREAWERAAALGSSQAEQLLKELR